LVKIIANTMAREAWQAALTPPEALNAATKATKAVPILPSGPKQPLIYPGAAEGPGGALEPSEGTPSATPE
jgi:hypothetical protein